MEYGGRVRIGIDDFALRLFGVQDEIEIPGLGTPAEQNRTLAVLKRDGMEAGMLSPVDGKVTAVNQKVQNQAELVNRDPYGQGWLMVIQPAALRNNLKNLFYGNESLAWIDDEYLRLQEIVAEASGHTAEFKMAATGGEAHSDIYGEMPEVGWERLVRAFLHSC